MSRGNSKLQLPPQILYGIKVRRLTRPLHDLNVLLLEPLLCSLSHMFLGHCHAGTPIHDPFSVSWLREGGSHLRYMAPVHPALDAVKSSFPLSRETAPKHNVSTAMLDGGDGVLGVKVPEYFSSSKHGESSCCQRP